MLLKCTKFFSNISYPKGFSNVEPTTNAFQNKPQNTFHKILPKKYKHKTLLKKLLPPWMSGGTMMAAMNFWLSHCGHHELPTVPQRLPWTSGSLVMAAINFWWLCGGHQELSAALQWPPFNFGRPTVVTRNVWQPCGGHQQPCSGRMNFWWPRIAAMKFRRPPPFSFFLLLWGNTLQFFIFQKHFSKFYQTIFCLWTPLNQLSIFTFFKTQSPNTFQNSTKPTPTCLWSSWRPTWFIK